MECLTALLMVLLAVFVMEEWILFFDKINQINDCLGGLTTKSAIIVFLYRVDFFTDKCGS